MKAAPFAYTRAESVEEALEALADPEARALAGGQMLVPMMVMRLARPRRLVDLNPVEELARVERGEDQVTVGAMVRQRDAELDRELGRAVPLLGAAMPWIGHRELRNRGTIGGSLAHADPATELPCVAVTLNATMVARNGQGTREIAARDFFTGAFRTTLGAGTLLTQVVWPTRRPGDGFAFQEVARRTADWMICGVAAHVRLVDGDVASAIVGLAGVADRPLVRDATGLLRGDDPDRFRLAAEYVVEDLDAAGALEANRMRAHGPSSDMHATPSYRLRLARVLTARCLEEAWRDATGGRS